MTEGRKQQVSRNLRVHEVAVALVMLLSAARIPFATRFIVGPAQTACAILVYTSYIMSVGVVGGIDVTDSLRLFPTANGPCWGLRFS